ncbi:uncharacterized protein METZ01_LOCUS286985, partial [marine metagenome]
VSITIFFAIGSYRFPISSREAAPDFSSSLTSDCEYPSSDKIILLCWPKLGPENF